MIPLVVIEGVLIGDKAVAAARSALERDGWLVLDGWLMVEGGPADPPRRGRVVRAGAVDDADSAAGAVLAALSGAGVLVAARAERALVDRLCEDLRRFGPVDHRLSAAARPDAEPDPGLTDPDRRLLELMLAGASLGEAAAAVHISRRTADRRIAALRRHYRVTSTAEALLAARRRGDLH